MQTLQMGRNHPSLMKHQFSKTPQVQGPGRSKFNRSHEHKTTGDAGNLVPIIVDEILPGDTVDMRCYGFGRLATPLTPLMHGLYLDTFFFFVPTRLVWDNWQKFCGEQEDPGDSIDFTVPIVAANAAGYSNQTVFDYFGLPTKLAASYNHSALPLRAYERIWNEWFRDQNLQDSLDYSTGDGPDLYTGFNLQKRGKRHDFFTSSLPWLQKGDAVSLPLGVDAPITGIGKENQIWSAVSKNVYETDGSGTVAYSDNAEIDGASVNLSFFVEEDPNNAGFPNIRADLTNATAATINDLRESFQIQKFLERDARSGTRYVEIIKSHFGVQSPDFRLQRTEYLGGGTDRVELTPIPQTSESSGTAQGTLTGVGTVHSSSGFIKSFTEHGLLIGLACLRADNVYQDGLERFWSRSTRYDYYWPVFAHLGEQPVYNREIYTQGTSDDALVFGYQARYDEYRYKPSRVSGRFRSNDAASLDSWHLAYDFGALPVLNASFIQEDPPIDRVIATPTEPHMLFDFRFNMMHTRPMPMYSVPGYIDHF